MVFVLRVEAIIERESDKPHYLSMTYFWEEKDYQADSYLEKQFQKKTLSPILKSYLERDFVSFSSKNKYIQMIKFCHILR